MNITITREEVDRCRDSGSHSSAVEAAFRRAGFSVCRVIDDAVLVWDQEKRLRAFLLPDYIVNLRQRDHLDLPVEPISFTLGMPIPVSCPDSQLPAQSRTRVRAIPRKSIVLGLLRSAAL